MRLPMTSSRARGPDRGDNPSGQGPRARAPATASRGRPPAFLKAHEDKERDEYQVLREGIRDLERLLRYAPSYHRGEGKALLEAAREWIAFLRAPAKRPSSPRRCPVNQAVRRLPNLPGLWPRSQQRHTLSPVSPPTAQAIVDSWRMSEKPGILNFLVDVRLDAGQQAGEQYGSTPGDNLMAIAGAAQAQRLAHLFRDQWPPKLPVLALIMLAGLPTMAERP